MPTWGPDPPNMPHLPHGQDQKCEQQQATQYAYQHPPDRNVPLLQGPKQLRLHLQTNPCMPSVTWMLSPKPKPAGWWQPAKPPTCLTRQTQGGPAPILLGTDTWEDQWVLQDPSPWHHSSILTRASPVGRLRAGTA